jgi:nicotinamidase-related amidase
MRSQRRTLALLVLLVVSCGEGNAGWTPPPGVDQGGAHGDAGAVDPDGQGEQIGVTDSGGPARPGIVVIDAQQLFVQWAANKDIGQIIDNIGALLQLAGQRATPLFITYEASKDASSGHNLAPALQPLVPGHAQEFIKTTFAATSLPAFAAAVKQANLTHLIVVGAETDVCVLQTVLGLRAMGHAVVLQKDAVFTSETNTGPALRRMEQAGVALASSAQVTAYLEGTSPLPLAQGGPVVIIKPMSIAFILNGLTDAALAGTQDPYKTAKLARLRELLLISEWFDVPLYSTTAGSPLPTQLAGLITKQIQPVAELAQSAVAQVVIAGSGAGLASLVSSQGASRDVFLLEDGLLASGAAAAHDAALEQLYTGGAVPLTYKALYYGMTKSVDLSEWPAAWQARDPIYYPKTKAPEDLPPIIK